MSNPISSGYVRGGGNTERWLKEGPRTVNASITLTTKDETKIVSATLVPLAETLISREVAQSQGFTGDQCTNCNSMRMKVSGHCMVCEDCGTTTGCS